MGQGNPHRQALTQLWEEGADTVRPDRDCSSLSEANDGKISGQLNDVVSPRNRHLIGIRSEAVSLKQLKFRIPERRDKTSINWNAE
jgi:hypothetical protein